MWFVHLCRTEVAAGSCACLDDPAGVPFIDRYTRMVSVSMALHNGNDFDIDDPEPDDETSDTSHVDDHYVAFQVSITLGAGGHLEKFDRINIVRPMRAYGWLNSAAGQTSAVVYAGVACLVMLRELHAVWRAGLNRTLEANY
eukprot:COSAG05_NODE_3184_length_2260_cov_5.884776_1_plen_142_part_00